MRLHISSDLPLELAYCSQTGNEKEAAALGLGFYVVASPEAANIASLRDAAVKLERFTSNRGLAAHRTARSYFSLLAWRWDRF